MKKVSVAIVICLCIFSGCSYRLTDFTIISTKNVDLSRAGQFKRVGDRKEGKDVAHIVLSIPFGRPNMKEAIDRAIESTKGAVALVDGVVYVKGWSAILYGQSMIIVEGSPLIDPLLAMNTDQLKKDTYTYLILGKNAEVKSRKEISKEEYDKVKNKIVKETTKRTFKTSAEIISE
jgi:hypothetical protein